MKVNVRYHGVIRDVTGAATAEFDLPDDATVDDLLQQMHRHYGQGFADRVLDLRLGVQTYVLLFLDGEQVDHQDLKTTRLSNGGSSATATLYVLPGSTGG